MTENLPEIGGGVKPETLYHVSFAILFLLLFLKF